MRYPACAFMAPPPFEDFMLPLLTAVSETASPPPPRTRDAVKRACKILGLSNDEMAQTGPGRKTSIVYDRATWASTYLKRAGLLESAGHGYLKITQRGSEVLAENPSKITRKYLSEFGVVDGDEDLGTEQAADDISSATPEETIQRGLEAQRSQLYQELKEALAHMSSTGFENLVLDVCKKMRYGSKSQHTGKSGDRGIDGVIQTDELGLEETYIQAKRRKDPIGAKDVRDFVGALARTSTKKGVFITTSSFTEEACVAASNLDGMRVILIDGDRLVELMNKYRTGVVEHDTIIINKVDSEYFD